MGYQGFDLPGWASQLGQLAAAGGGSVVVVKLIERAFARDDREATDRASISAELRQEVRELRADVEAMRRENTDLQIRVAQAEAREQWVRNRYHRLVNWMQSEPTLPQPPSYLFEPIPDAKPPEEPKP